MPDFRLHDLGGNCPVQAEGTINGKPFYFRARHTSWTFSVGGDPYVAPEWEHEETWGDGSSDAGWMTAAEARACIHKAARLYTEQTSEL